MSHHGWVDVIDVNTLTPDTLKAPFGRLFAARDHTYDSHAISLLAGALGPLQEDVQTLLLAGADSPSKDKLPNHAGFTFLGQFIDHDMTEFRVVGQDLALILQNPSIGQRQVVLEDLGRIDGARRPTTTNGRTGTLDLDSVYGLLGTAQPDLFSDDGLFLLQDGVDIIRGDAFRNRRLIADPRNDENKLVVQVHLLFERLHNALHAAKSGGPTEKGPTGATFLGTRAEVVEAYHRIVLHDYLPRLVRAEHLLLVLDRLKTGDSLYQAMNARSRDLLKELGLKPKDARRTLAMPVEFSHAAFRLGHSQLRNGYLLRTESDGTAIGVPLFNTGGGSRDLRGNAPLVPTDQPSFLVDWENFFKTTPTAPQTGNAIDGNLPRSIFRLPPPTVGEPPVSLAERNIRRGIDFGLPSGQEAAAELAAVYGFIDATRLSEIFPQVIYEKVGEVLQTASNLQWATPLWYYILMEAGVTPGPQLGPVGGLIVAETLLGAIVEQRRANQSVNALEASVEAIENAYADLPPHHEDQEAGDLAWNKAIDGVEDIFTMSHLIRFVEGNGPVPALALRESVNA